MDDVAASGMRFRQPVPILAEHDTSSFACGHDALDDWLKTRALRSEGRSARTYVVCDETDAVVGYYCLAMGAVAHPSAPGKLKRNAPDPIPVAIIGRLAVAKRAERLGVGGGMLQDGLRRILQVADTIGCRAVLVHAIDDTAAAFYERYEFVAFPSGGRTLFLPVETLGRSLG